MSRQAIHDLIERKIIAKDDEGLIDSELAKVALQQRVRPSGKTAAALAAPPAPPPNLPAPVPPPPDGEVNPAAATSYHVARTLREAEEAKMARMRRMKEEAALIEREPAVAAVFTAFRTLRDTMMTLGRAVSAEAAAMTDRREIQLMVDEHVRRRLAEFRDKTLAAAAADLNAGKPSPTPQDLAIPTPEKDTP